jgi:hypothetical protein
MTVTSIALYVVVFGLVLARRVKGQPLTTPKKLFLLPIVVAIVGLQDLRHTTMNPTDVAVVVVGRWTNSRRETGCRGSAGELHHWWCSAPPW